MLRNRLGNSGPIAYSCEECEVTFPAMNGGDTPTITFPVQSPLKPGAAVFVTIDEVNTPGGPAPYFLIMQSAVQAVGTASITVYAIIGQPSQNFELHVLIVAHNLEQCGT